MIRRLTQVLLRRFAEIRLARTRPAIVAITGSVGKTTTKDAVFTVLAHAFGERVRRSAGNLNTEEGVPLAILDFTATPTRWEYPGVLFRAVSRAFTRPRAGEREILVLELSAEKPNDIAYLVSFLAPYLTVGVVTSVGPIHLNAGQFPSVTSIAQEKGKLIEALPDSGWALLNKDNPYTKAMAEKTRARVVWFTEQGMDTAFGVAKAVGRLFKVSDRSIETALEGFSRPSGRWTELPGIKGSLVIDDSYNANPMSVEEALKQLATRSGRTIAVLGDLLELGAKEKLYHGQVGKLARNTADVVVGVGRRARWYRGTYHFATPYEGAPFLKKFVRAGDIVLIKGSQSMRMELVSEALLADSADCAKLPRQSPAWKQRPFVQP